MHRCECASECGGVVVYLHRGQRRWLLLLGQDNYPNRVGCMLSGVEETPFGQGQQWAVLGSEEAREMLMIDEECVSS